MRTPGHQERPWQSSVLVESDIPFRRSVVGYDNHYPKEDHRHFRGAEETYHYKDPETLIRDFLRDVEMVLTEKEGS